MVQQQQAGRKKSFANRWLSLEGEFRQKDLAWHPSELLHMLFTSNSKSEPRDWMSRSVSPDDAVQVLRGGMRVFVHGASATPTALLEAMVRRTDIENIRLYHLHLAGPIPFTGPQHAGRFHSVSFFAGESLRRPIEEARADFMPIFLSDIPGLFQSGQIPLDAAILQLSPPDAHGWCSLGTSVDAARAAADTAKVIIAEINEQMPRTHGAALVPFDRVAAFTHTDRPLIEHERDPITAIHARIGELVAGLVEDGSTLQLGIGAIPDAVLLRLGEKRDLGIHTEMFSDGLVDLYATGAITNRLKAIHPKRLVTSFVTGTRKVFDFVRDNPAVEFHPCDRTNDTGVLRKLERLVAINSAIEIDLTGQVCADSIGHRIFSGIGGQVDFIRGAALSRGGKPIIAMPSTAANGKVSRIVPILKPGAGVVTTRGHVHWVATEYGAVNLHGRTLRERADALISITHPDFRAELAREASTIRRLNIGSL
jgi:acyl-CoA hydrolase